MAGSFNSFLIIISLPPCHPFLKSHHHHLQGHVYMPHRAAPNDTRWSLARSSADSPILPMGTFNARRTVGASTVQTGSTNEIFTQQNTSNSAPSNVSYEARPHARLICVEIPAFNSKGLRFKIDDAPRVELKRASVAELTHLSQILRKLNALWRISQWIIPSRANYERTRPLKMNKACKIHNKQLHTGDHE